MIMLIGTKGSTELETSFCVLVLFFTVGMFATILNTFNQIMDEIQRKAKDYKQAKNTLNKFIKNNEIEAEMQVNIIILLFSI
jgi:1,4-dihydroxy-2-naphthoate octaprenyltransferase